MALNKLTSTFFFFWLRKDFYGGGGDLPQPREPAEVRPPGVEGEDVVRGPAPLRVLRVGHRVLREERAEVPARGPGSHFQVCFSVFKCVLGSSECILGCFRHYIVSIRHFLTLHSVNKTLLDTM